MLSDWLKNLPPVSQSMRSKSNTNHTVFFRALNKLQVIARNSDWFIATFVPVVIGRNNNFGIVFWTVV